MLWVHPARKKLDVPADPAETLPEQRVCCCQWLRPEKAEEAGNSRFRRSIGVVFQDFRLIPTMNVFDNVAFSLRVTDASKRFIRNQVPYVLDLMGLVHKAKSYPNELSGGEQQRGCFGTRFGE